MGEFLAYQVGLKGPTMIQAVGLMIDLTELYRDKLERHMKYQREIYGIPGTPSSECLVKLIADLQYNLERLSTL